MNEWYVVKLIDGTHYMDMVVAGVKDESEAETAALAAARRSGRWSPFVHAVEVEHRILTTQSQLDNRH